MFLFFIHIFSKENNNLKLGIVFHYNLKLLFDYMQR